MRGELLKFPGQWFREGRGMAFYTVQPGRVCPNCRQPEVQHPMQTCAPPKVAECLRCGYVDEDTEFTEGG